jgi:hypothetical protein
LPRPRHRNAHGRNRLAILVVGHYGREIRAADKRQQPPLNVIGAGNALLEIVEQIDVRDDCVMRHALQRLVAEVTRLAAPDHWRTDLQVGEAAQTGQCGDNRRCAANGMPR